ncbi:MAG: RsmB/NOP family class I SAM-dependent RNA methyltransferase, partial [Rhodospirillales bacterium]|nr:RsmB/NOP family class I SAM-dependent RNA methyltransferase [Rhodospirillales bacterium]
QHVVRKHQPLDDGFEAHPGAAALDARDRAFAFLLVATTLRRLGQIDALIDHCLKKALASDANTVLDILRLGVCQLVFLETPAHAAIHTSVDLARARKQGRHEGLVNAILRRLSREGRNLIETQDPAQLNTPDWLWESWTHAFGAETCRRIAEAHLLEPPLDLTPKIDRQQLADRLGGRALPTGTVRLTHRGPISSLPGFADGDWWVQDAAAAIPATLLGDVRGRRVIDLCAAPGGKTAQLAAAGAKVTAVDRSRHRLRRLTDNLRRLDLCAEVIAADALTWTPLAPADAVLLDAPCSATGTIRRHPDVPIIKTRQDVAKLVTTQTRLLRAARRMVKPGGILVYCVCSLQSAEGQDLVAAQLAEDDGLRRDPIGPKNVGGLEEMVTPVGELRTLPCHLADAGGMDGFYGVRLRVQ